MTFHNRYPSHRHLRARGRVEDFFSSILSPSDTADTAEAGLTPTKTAASTEAAQSTTPPSFNHNDHGNDNDNGQDHNQPSSISIQRPPDSTTSSTTSAPTTHRGGHLKTSTTTEQPETTSTSTSSKETSTTPITTSTTSFSSSSTLISTSTPTKPTSTPPITITAPVVTKTHTTAPVTPTPDAIAIPSATPSVSAAPSTGLSTGAIVGSVAGGIAGLVAIFFIVAFLLRRWRRNRIHDEDFNPEVFVRSPMTETGSGYNNNPFEPTPPNPAFRHHSIAPSIGSGPNMAGQGAYSYGNDGAYTDVAYNNVAHAAGGAVAYGTYEAHANDDVINGAYSAEPRPQQAFNAEAYGSYAYSTDGVHAVTSGAQHAHPYSNTEYQAHYQDNVPVPAAGPAHTQAPALVAGAPAVPANRAPSVYNVEDAYGGI